MINKKGNIMAVIYIVGALFLLLIIGAGIAFGGVMIDWIFDIATPELTGLGMVGSTNTTQIAGATIVPMNNLVQSFTWMSGLLYVFGIFGCLGLAYAFRFTGNKWLMTFFFLAMFLLIVASVFMSNIYETFYSSNDDIGLRLHQYTGLSYLILYSPMIMAVIGFICGIIMFSGNDAEGGGI